MSAGAGFRPDLPRCQIRQRCFLRKLCLAAIIVLPLLGLAGAEPALAHALFERSTPAPGALLSATPKVVRITFSEDLNPSASKIIVWNRNRQVENVGDTQLVPGQTRQMEVGLNPLAPGAYLVLWTSVSAADGHVLRGAYLFYVKKRGPGPSLAGVSSGGSVQAFPDGPTLTSIVVHWLELFSAVTWMGAETFFLFVVTPVTSRLPRDLLAREGRWRMALVCFSLDLLVLSSTVVMLMLAYGLTGSWSDVLKASTWSELFAAQYGKLWIARQVIALVASVLTLAPQRRPALSPSLGAAGASPPWRQPMALIVIGLGAIYLYLFAASGHAASVNFAQFASSRVFTGAVLADWLHFVGDALWLGGQFYIVAVLIPSLGVRRPRAGAPIGPLLDTLNRFSLIAYASITLFILSGVFNAYVHVPGFYAFFNSVYGKTLIIKILLIGIMMGVSALTVYSIRPRLQRMLRAGGEKEPGFLPMFRTLVSLLEVNPVLGAAVLLATSVLFYYPVPFGFGSPGPSSYIVQRSGITATVAITPDHSGENQIRVSLTDQQGHPIARASVRVLATMRDMSMGIGITPLSPQGQSGVFTGPVELAMGGHWRLVLLVYQPHGLARLTLDVRVGL